MNYLARGKVEPAQARSHAFLPPSRGWIANENLGSATPGGASVLDNWTPTATGSRLRGGTRRWHTVGDTSNEIEALFSYSVGTTQELFAATKSYIFDASDASLESDTLINDASEDVVNNTGEIIELAPGATDGLAKYSGLGVSGKWISQQFTTSGGTFLRLVNGSDPSLTYDGTTFSDSAHAITGIDTKDLSYVWSYKNRLFFCEKNSLNAWYLSVDAIAGAATKFPLGAVFKLGGSLLFGSSWSLNDNGGLADRCVFVTTEGEIAVYGGTNPASAADWSLVGLYRIGKPLGNRAFMRSGGDLLIATDIGLIPLSQAVDKALGELSPAAISYPIEGAWNDEVKARPGVEWFVEMFPVQQIGVVAPGPYGSRQNVFFVVNLRTGAWSRWTNTRANCLLAFNNQLFFGTSNGVVMEAEKGGSDNGIPYTGVLIPLFDDCGAPGLLKTTTQLNAVFLADSNPLASVGMLYDYRQNTRAAPSAFIESEAAVWGTGAWGTAEWGVGRSKQVYIVKRSAPGSGIVVAPVVQVTSSGTSAPSVELARVDVAFEQSLALT